MRILFKVLEKVFSLMFCLESLISIWLCWRFIMNRFDVLYVVSCKVDGQILHFVSFIINCFWRFELFIDEIPAIRFHFLNVGKGNPLLFFIVRILGFINRWIDLIFLEMILFTVMELILEIIMIHNFLVERVFANHVAIGEAVAYRFWNWMFGDGFLSFIERLTMLIAVKMIYLIWKCVALVVERWFLGILIMISFQLSMATFPMQGLILWVAFTRTKTCWGFSLAFGLLNSWNVAFDHVSHFLFSLLVAKIVFRF